MILLGLIYFASCSSACSNVLNPDKPEQCYKTGTGEVNNVCCFLREPTFNYRLCMELPKGVDYQKYVNDYLPNLKGYTVSCLSSYLKTSLVFLAALALL